MGPDSAYDGAAHPSYSMSQFTPATVPGCRTPHVWLGDGRSLYDAMGPEFTLLRFDAAVDVAALETAARNKAVPLKVFDLEPKEPCYEGKLVLSRPDQHVAWRGNHVPDDPAALIDRIRGAADPRLAR